MTTIETIKNTIKNLKLAHADAYIHRCLTCNGRGGEVRHLSQTHYEPACVDIHTCAQCYDKGYDPLNINLKMTMTPDGEGYISPTAGFDLLDPDRPKTLIIDQINEAVELLDSLYEEAEDGL